jgi:hypothetical protein
MFLEGTGMIAGPSQLLYELDGSTLERPWRFTGRACRVTWLRQGRARTTRRLCMRYCMWTSAKCQLQTDIDVA